jgi:hypothetical protein
MVQACAGHLRIGIHESKRNSLCADYADLLQNDDSRIQNKLI